MFSPAALKLMRGLASFVASHALLFSEPVVRMRREGCHLTGPAASIALREHPHSLPGPHQLWPLRSRLRGRSSAQMLFSGGSEEEEEEEGGALARPKNRYVEAIQNITAPELIKAFAETAPADVQQAVRSTVVSLLGNLPPHLYDVNVMSTGQNVASLMYSMQMTGYMVRRALQP